MAKQYDLSRFIRAHEADYPRALKELKNGHKDSHWMWYIFPQIKGLGMSSTAVHYSIEDIGEARAYMENEILGEHMRTLCKTLIGLENDNASEIFGWPDDMKLKSSMTLFEVAVPEENVFAQVLDKFFDGERDSKTIDILD